MNGSFVKAVGGLISAGVLGAAVFGGHHIAKLEAKTDYAQVEIAEIKDWIGRRFDKLDARLDEIERHLRPYR